MVSSVQVESCPYLITQHEAVYAVAGHENRSRGTQLTVDCSLLKVFPAAEDVSLEIENLL